MSHRIATVLGTAIGTGLLLGLTAGPAAARPEPQPASGGEAFAYAATVIGHQECPLRELDGQLLRCDDLTGGDGTTAPLAVPAWRSAG